MSEDIKVKKLEARFGLTGYAIYNKLLETIYKYKGEFNLRDEDDLHLFASAWKITAEQLREIINYCIKVKLFTDENLSSKGIAERIKAIEHLREKKRSYYKRGEEGSEVSGIQNNGSGIINFSKSTQSKGNESKENKSSVCTHTHNFENFHKHITQDDDYSELKDYDLKYYFDRVINFYPDKKFSHKELKAKIIFFIGNDKKSQKHEPVKNLLVKKDSVTVAFELVQQNLDWIKLLPDKNPDEVVPQLVQRCRHPARNDTLFEAYVEKALRHYILQ